MAIEALSGVSVRTELRPGDLGYIAYMHGVLYAREYGFGLSFERYVAEGLSEFASRYDAERDRVWICEQGGRIIGSILAMSRGELAQIRYFLIEPEYRGAGLGRRLVASAVSFLKERGYEGAYLWTVDALEAAARLYTDAGFCLTEERPSDLFGVPVIERRYDLRLRPKEG